MRYLADKVPRFIAPLGVGARLQSRACQQQTSPSWVGATPRSKRRALYTEALHYSARWRTGHRAKPCGAPSCWKARARYITGAATPATVTFAKAGKKYGGFDLAFMKLMLP